MDIFFKHLLSQTNKIQALFDESKSVWHNVSSGTIRENIVQEILLPFLPECYGISSGICFDCKNNRSKQLDLVIYDKLFSYKLPLMKNFIIFPCESVYGNIEIKSYLNKESLKESIHNIASLKKLEREDATEFDFSPQFRLEINGKTQGTKKNFYFGIVFSYESDSASCILNNLKKIDVDFDTQYFPDMFILFDKKTIIFRASKLKDNSYALELGTKSNGYVAIETGEYTIAYFIFALLIILKSSHLRSPNLGIKLLQKIIEEKHVINSTNYIEK